jgi:hypothetical protein
MMPSGDGSAGILPAIVWPKIRRRDAGTTQIGGYQGAILHPVHSPREQCRLIVGGQRGAGLAPRCLQRNAQLLVLVLELVETVIDPAQGEKLLV